MSEFLIGEPEILNSTLSETSFKLAVEHGSIFTKLNHDQKRYEVSDVVSSLPHNALAASMVRACLEHAKAVEAPALFVEAPNKQAAAVYRAVLGEEADIFIGKVAKDDKNIDGRRNPKIFVYCRLIDPSVLRSDASLS